MCGLGTSRGSRPGLGLGERKRRLRLVRCTRLDPRLHLSFLVLGARRPEALPPWLSPSKRSERSPDAQVGGESDQAQAEGGSLVRGSSSPSSKAPFAVIRVARRRIHPSTRDRHGRGTKRRTPFERALLSTTPPGAAHAQSASNISRLSRRWFRPDIELDGRHRLLIDSEVIAFLAGPLAERRISERANRAGAAHDYEQAADLALRVGGDGRWRVRVPPLVPVPVGAARRGSVEHDSSTCDAPPRGGEELGPHKVSSAIREAWAAGVHSSSPADSAV